MFKKRENFKFSINTLKYLKFYTTFWVHNKPQNILIEERKNFKLSFDILKSSKFSIAYFYDTSRYIFEYHDSPVKKIEKAAKQKKSASYGGLSFEVMGFGTKSRKIGGVVFLCFWKGYEWIKICEFI